MLTSDLTTRDVSTRDREYVLAETRIEERDGATWVSGICPGCWERFAFLAPPRGHIVKVRCPNEHHLRIVEQTSEGRTKR